MYLYFYIYVYVYRYKNIFIYIYIYSIYKHTTNNTFFSALLITNLTKTCNYWSVWWCSQMMKKCRLLCWLFQTSGARVAQSQRRNTRTTEGALAAGGGERHRAAAWPAHRCACQEAFCPREEALWTGHGREAHQPHLPQAHWQLRQEADRGHGWPQVLHLLLSDQ